MNILTYIAEFITLAILVIGALAWPFILAML